MGNICTVERNPSGSSSPLPISGALLFPQAEAEAPTSPKQKRKDSTSPLSPSTGCEQSTSELEREDFFRLPISRNSSFCAKAAAFTPMARAGSPRRSFGDGAVGLGIVAAMGARESLPIPIVSAAVGVASGFLERSESYTCVVSHEGNGYVRRRVYLGGGGEEVAGDAGGGRVVFFQSPPPPLAMLPVDGFLRNCCLCGKSLHGIDIFMYRGEKAFCSTECRFQQILGDEHREKCFSKVLKTGEYSVSPCSVPVQFTTGVTAA